MTFDEPYPEPLECLRLLVDHGYIISISKEREGRYRMDLTGPVTDHGLANSPELCLQMLWAGNREYLATADDQIAARIERASRPGY